MTREPPLTDDQRARAAAEAAAQVLAAIDDREREPRTRRRTI